MSGRLSRLRSVDVLVAVPDLRQLVVDRLFLDLSRLRQILGVPLSQILVVLDGVVLGFHQELLTLFIAHASEHFQLLFIEQIVHLAEGFGELRLFAERNFLRTGHFLFELLRLWFLRWLHESLTRIFDTDLVELLVEVCDLGMSLLYVLLVELHVDTAAVVGAHALVDHIAQLLALFKSVPFLFRPEVVIHPLAAAPKVIRARGIVGENLLKNRACLG